MLFTFHLVSELLNFLKMIPLHTIDIRIIDRITSPSQEEILAKSIPFQLQRLFLALQTSKKRAVETTDITKSFGWDSSEAWQQHDIQVLRITKFESSTDQKVVEREAPTKTVAPPSPRA